MECLIHIIDFDVPISKFKTPFVAHFFGANVLKVALNMSILYCILYMQINKYITHIAAQITYNTQQYILRGHWAGKTH